MSKQEAVAWRYKDYHDKWVLSDEYNQYYPKMKAEPLYTHPAPSWQGLSDDEIRNVFDKNSEVIRKETGFFDMIDFARAIEQALKEKNK